MVLRAKKPLVLGLAAVFGLHLFQAPRVYSELSDKEREKLRRKIETLERKKADLHKELDTKIDKIDRKTTKNRGESIRQYEEFYRGCTGKRNDPRCAQVLYRLASLYYEESRERFLRAQDRFEGQLKRWDKRGKVGPPPASPVPHYEKSARAYEKLIKDHPKFPQLDRALYLLGGIYIQAGKPKLSFQAYKRVVDQYPRSEFMSQARLRVGDYLYMTNRPDQALEYFKGVGADVGPKNYSLAHFRIASCLYALSQYRDAIDKYFNYVERCDRGEFPSADFRDEALQYLAASFAEVGDPIKEAKGFFSKRGGRKYEVQIYYNIGKNCRENDRNKEAIEALQYVLDTYPGFPKAPEAQRLIVDSYAVMRNFEKANLAREKLIDEYGPGTKWYRKYSSDPKVMAEARKELERTLQLIPLFFHDKGLRENDAKSLERAVRRYKQYIEMFPEEKWRVYEFSFNLAECLMKLKRYEEAAEYYDFVATAPVKSYGQRKERAMEDTTQKVKPAIIKQEDAGYNAVIALYTAWKVQKQTKGMSDKEAYRMPLTGKLIKYIRKYSQVFSGIEAAADLLFLGASLAYNAEQYQDAIPIYRKIISSYPRHKDTPQASRMLAQSYVFTNDYEQAIGIYKQLIVKVKQTDPEHARLQKGITSAMYKLAEKAKEEGQPDVAAQRFIILATQYPKTEVAPIALFDAAVLYDKKGAYQQAASTFLKVGRGYPKSKQGPVAMAKAAEAYSKVPNLRLAAQTYEMAQKQYPSKKDGLPALSSAAETYMKIPAYNSAARVYEAIYKNYPKEKGIAKILYNAGLTYEKAKNYAEAIRVYKKLEKAFPRSEYAPDALFSVALTYGNLKNNRQMVAAYEQYVRKYQDDKYKLVQAYMKIAGYHYRNKQHAKAEKIYRQIANTYRKFRKKADIDPAAVAEAHFMIGEIRFQEFAAVKFTGGPKTIRKRQREKERLLNPVVKSYTEAIKFGIEEWTLRATYQIGSIYIEFANTLRNQTVRGSAEQKIGQRIQIYKELPAFYEKGEGFFYKNVEMAQQQNIKNKWVAKSKDKFLEMRYRQAYVLEEIAGLLKKAPIPRDLRGEDRTIYKEKVEETIYEFKEKALPIYESGVRAAMEVGIVKSPWLAKLKKRIKQINPTSKVLVLKPKPKAPVQQARAGGGPAVSRRRGDPELFRALQRIKAITERDIPVSAKIKQLRRIERDAKRAIEKEKARIQELRARAKKG